MIRFLDAKARDRQVRIAYGHRKIRVLLKREGWNVGKKLVYRLYREEGLTLHYNRRKRRHAATNRRERCGMREMRQGYRIIKYWERE